VQGKDLLPAQNTFSDRKIQVFKIMSNLETDIAQIFMANLGQKNGAFA